MSEITKLYENAGVEYYDRYFSCKKDEDLTCQDNCEICDNAKEVKCYPPFTAEKLINLEMFLINKGDFDIKKGSVDITFESFTSCIAGLINTLWQSLTSEEKQQVKGILE